MLSEHDEKKLSHDVLTTRKYKKAWKTEIIDEILKELPNFPFSIMTIYDVYQLFLDTYFQRVKWTTENILTIVNALKDSKKIFVLELPLQTPKPLPIYPGRHAVSSVIFITDINLPDREVKCKNYLSQLIEAQKLEELLKKKIQKSKQYDTKLIHSLVTQSFFQKSQTNPKEEFNSSLFLKPKDSHENPIKKERHRSKSNSNFTPSPLPSHKIKFSHYISGRNLRLNIFHTFLFTTFGNGTFSAMEIFNKMPFSLYIKICEADFLPKVFCINPSLTSILISYLPRAIFNSQRKQSTLNVINSLISQLSQYRLIVQQGNNIKLFTSKISFSYYHFPCSFDFSFIIDLNSFSGIESYWRMIQNLDIIENFHTFSSSTAQKRWCIRTSSSMTQSPLILSLGKTIFKGEHNFYKEKIIRTLGIEWLCLEPYIKSNSKGYIEETRWKSFLDQVQHNFNYTIMHTSNTNEFKHYFLDYFLNDKNQLFNSFQNSHSDLNSKGISLKDKLKLLILKAASRTTIDYVLTENNFDTSILNDFIQYGFSHELFPKSLNFILTEMLSQKEYFDLFYNFLATFLSSKDISYSQINSSSEDNLLPLSQTELINFGSIKRKLLIMDPNIGETFEALKHVYFSNYNITPLSSILKYLSNFSSDSAKEALDALLLGTFLVQQRNKNTTFIMRNYRIFPNTLITRDCLTTYRQLFLTPDSSVLVLDDKNCGSLLFVLNQGENFQLTIFFEKYIPPDNKVLALKRVQEVYTLEFYFKKKLYTFPPLKIQIDQKSVSEQNIFKKFEDNKTENSDKNSFEEISEVLEHISYIITKLKKPYPLFLTLIVYSTIYHNGAQGIDLKVLEGIIQNFLLVPIINFLIEFNFVEKLPTCNKIPILIAIKYSRSKLKHFWNTIEGENDDLLMRTKFRIMEIIEANAGIDLIELYDKMSILSISDLIYLTNEMENEEMIVVRDYQVIEGNIFEPYLEIPNLRIDDNLIFLQNNVKRRFFIAKLDRI